MKVTFQDKVTFDERIEVPIINKGRSEDWNEVKNVVNFNDDNKLVTSGEENSIQLRDSDGNLIGYIDLLWDNSLKQLKLADSSLKSVDDKLELYDNTGTHYMNLVGEDKGIDPIDPIIFNILVKSTVPSGYATFTLQNNYQDGLSFIAAADRYLKFDTLNNFVELHQNVKLKGAVIQGDKYMEALVYDSASGEIKRFEVIEEAPRDNKLYGRRNGMWVEIT